VKSKTSVFKLFAFVGIFCSVFFLAFFIENANAETALTVEKIQDGLTDPIFLTSPPGDTSRLFILEQDGLIKIIKNGTLLPTPFLDVSSLISSGGERGLLGLAFHPDYALNGYFYINYTDTGGDTKVRRCKVSSDPDIAEPDSLVTILSIDQPYPNHNGGMIAFGPNDGYLYIGMGDGGSAGDPGDRAQTPTTLLGKMLRIDVDGGFPYAIPSTNPYFNDPDTLEEIWALGVRNPWRYSFDSETGDMYMGDVGQNEWEEINFQPGSSSGGENYGWRLKEATHCYDPPTNCDPGGLTDPITEYDHGPECSITGGYVYRGCAIPDLQGTYFYADYCSNKIWSFRYDGSIITDSMERTSELVPPEGSYAGIVSFAEDDLGELYIIDQGRDAIYKIVPVETPDCNNNGRNDNCDISLGVSSDENQNGVPDECESGYDCGDANDDGSVNVSDAVWIINYVFIGGDPPDPLASGDANCDGSVNVSDAVWIINYIFIGGNAPCDTDGDGMEDC
jgi:glucose/arabinose dehydrogenase